MRRASDVAVMVVLAMTSAGCARGVRAPHDARANVAVPSGANATQHPQQSVFEFRAADLALSYRSFSFRLNPERLAAVRELGITPKDWVVRLELTEANFTLWVRREAGTPPTMSAGRVEAEGIHMVLRATDGSGVGAVKLGDAIRLARLPDLDARVRSLEDDGFVLVPR